MAEHVVPHFHNDPGVPLIEIGAKEFMCVGATPPSTIRTSSSTWAPTTKSSVPIARRLYRLDASLDPHAAQTRGLRAAADRSLVSLMER